jgi:phytoene dehydrogenase-like protein
VYFAADRRPFDPAALALNADLPGIVNHVAVTSSASPSLAPSGSHLVAATVLGNPGGDDGALARSVLYEMRQWFPLASVQRWSPLAVYRIPLAQPKQPPGFFARRARTDHAPGVWLATETCFHASLEGAVLAGRSAAQSVLAQRMRAAS